MVFALAPEADTPLYLQIREGLKRDIAAGVLTPGTRLPSSRQLAHDLGVSRITTANAYAELEADGVVEARPGSGTYVLPPHRMAIAPLETPAPATDEPPEWQSRLRRLRIHGDRNRMLREAVRSRGTDGSINFAWARGDVRLFALAEFRRAMAEAMERDGPAALQYEQAEGYPPLRSAVAGYLRQLGLQTCADDIVITAGAQQAIDLLARALLEPGDIVAVEEPTYPGALESFEAAGATLFPVPLDSEGMRADALETALAAGARMIYTVPTFHNPTGTVMSASRRREVLALADEFGVPLLEDEYLREVRFGSPIPPPIAAFDTRGTVIHIGSFSKSLLPALRLGYIVARQPMRSVVAQLKRAADGGSSALLQRALHAHLESGRLTSHWARASRIYRRRQATMIAAIKRHFPAATSWTAAPGGVVLWVRVPEGVSVNGLLEEALANGVSFAIGSAFFTKPADQGFMRLNFAAIDEPDIERGIATLGRLVEAQLSRR